MNIYISNLDLTVENDDLKSLFEQYGMVDAATIIRDRDTGISLGFGFVEMPDPEAAAAAVIAIEGRHFKGRTMSATCDREKSEFSSRMLSETVKVPGTFSASL